MRKWWPLLLLLPLSAGAAVYRWVDRHGVVHYSDRPVPKAKKANLPGLQKAKPVPGGFPAAPKPAPRASAPTLTLIRPKPDQTYRDARGLVPVNIVANDGLGPGERLVYYLDGRPAARPTRKTEIQLTGVVRGRHSVSAALVRNGHEITRTEPVTIFLHPPTGLTPLRRSAPNANGPQPAGTPAPPITPPSGGAPAAPRFGTGD